MKKLDTKSRGMALEELKSHLSSGEFAPLYLFYGEETYLRDFYLQELKKKILPTGAETFNLHTFDGKNMDIFALEQALDSFPMMAERTLVLVTDWDLYKLAESPRKKLLELLEDLPDYATLVFFYDTISYNPDGRTKIASVLGNVGCVVEFPYQTEDKLMKWVVNQRFPSMGKTISPDLARELIFYCGESMTNLVSEIEKIGAFASGEEITKEDIYAVATPHINAIVFAMTDALGEKKFDLSLKILGDLFQMEGKSKGQKQEKELGILGAISRQMRQIYQAKLAQEQGKGEPYVASLLGVQSFIARRILSISRQFSLEWCRNAVILCGETDRAMKSTGQNGERLLTQLLLDLALAEGEKWKN